MEIERALEVIGKDGLKSGQGTWEEFLEAIQLGREALKGIKKVRKTLEPYVTALLPGETKETGK
ncbi:hypothetical protein ES703_22470 [subsurface metagenome]